MSDPSRMTDREYWDRIHAGEPPLDSATSVRRRHGLLRRLAARLFGEKIFTSYSDHLLWRVILPRYLPRGAGLKALEIGSAPGVNLVRLRDEFGYEPYGVEYSAEGVKRNRDLFAARGVPVSNLVHADAFSNDFREKYREYFDLVTSHGFVEHFREPEEALRLHLELLKPTGMLVVTIPNLRGLNRLMLTLLNPPVLEAHNLHIMELRNFRASLDSQQIDLLRCGYYGMFSFRLLTAKPGDRIGSRVVRICRKLEGYLGAAHRVVLRNLALEHRVWSFGLICIGRKRALDSEGRSQ